jgi:hypothetical protein
MRSCPSIAAKLLLFQALFKRCTNTAKIKRARQKSRVMFFSSRFNLSFICRPTVDRAGGSFPFANALQLTLEHLFALECSQPPLQWRSP